jgi:ABC-type multidrug transport system fused ATPase/permease subunit
MAEVIESLRSITEFLNMPTESAFLQHHTKNRWDKTVRRIEVTMQESKLSDDDDPAADKVNLEMNNVSFAYELGKPVISNLNAQFPQGKLIAVLGPRVSGKSTFLRVLAQELMPKDGVAFVPLHLRVLYVTQEPFMMNLSLWQNLTFGNDRAELPWVKDILERLQLGRLRHMLDAETPQDTTDVSTNKTLCGWCGCCGKSAVECAQEFTDTEAEDGTSWQSSLTATEKMKLNFARAVIYNPEVLLIERPLFPYDQDSSALIMKCLKEHVHERGLCLPRETIHQRRPRTCLFTEMPHMSLAYDADMVYCMLKDGSLRMAKTQ